MQLLNSPLNFHMTDSPPQGEGVVSKGLPHWQPQPARLVPVHHIGVPLRPLHVPAAVLSPVMSMTLIKGNAITGRREKRQPRKHYHTLESLPMAICTNT